MAVVARLSKRFYDEFGEDLANELVELLNQVDDSSRKELRELNELNFARFDAKLEQRIADTNARIEALAATVVKKEDLALVKSDVIAMKGALAESVADRFTAQNRFLYLAMAMQLAATLSLWLR